MTSKKTISFQFNSTAIHLAQLCDCEMRRICISYCLNKTFSLQCRTATTKECVRNGGPGGRGGAGCCWGGLLEGRSGGVGDDCEEMGSVCMGKPVGGLLSGENSWNRRSERRPMSYV